MSELDKEHLSSDESDEDFVPSDGDLPSEEESDGEEENDTNVDGTNTCDNVAKKRSKQNKRSKKKRKLEHLEIEEPKEEAKPTRSLDDIWAEFTSKKEEPSKLTKEEVDTNTSKPITVTQVCSFAGEEVKVEKTLPATPNIRGHGRGRGGGLSGILGNLGKPQKLSILDKSKLDWQQFKQKEGIEEQLSTFNKGKDGFLEKQDFLQRTDLRQFEMEKEMRNATRKTLR